MRQTCAQCAVSAVGRGKPAARCRHRGRTRVRRADPEPDLGLQGNWDHGTRHGPASHGRHDSFSVYPRWQASALSICELTSSIVSGPGWCFATFLALSDVPECGGGQANANLPCLHQKKAQPRGVALEFHQRRRFWRSVPILDRAPNTTPLCQTPSPPTSSFCCFATKNFRRST